MMDPPYDGPKLEARTSSPAGRTATAVQRLPEPAPREAEDPFRYGSRWVEVTTPEGTTFREVPLTWEDLFDPQEGDQLAHSNQHGETISETKEKLKCFFAARGRDDVVVCDDFKMLWKDSELAKIAPDVVVIPGMKDPSRYRASFNEAEEGTSPIFVLEVASKATREFDEESKPEIYCKAGVDECFLVNQLSSPWKLQGFRLDVSKGEYRPIEPNAEGGLPAESLGVVLRIVDDDLVLTDASTGEVLNRPVDESLARRREAEAREAAERRAEQEAEARRQEAEARQAAERRAEAAEAQNRKLLAELKKHGWQG